MQYGGQEASSAKKMEMEGTCLCRCVGCRCLWDLYPKSEIEINVLS